MYVYVDMALKRVKKEITVQEGDQFLCNVAFGFIVHIAYLFLK